MTDHNEDLTKLRWHWGSAYRISLVHTRWIAVRRDNGSVIRRDSPEGLLKAIREDYRSTPIPRPRSLTDVPSWVNP